MVGPGYTKWEADDEGNVVQRWHNDDGWVTHVASKDDLRPWKVALLMQKAYEAGLADKALEIRRALGVQ